MESLSPQCQDLKRMYDQCFNDWFSEKFLKGETKDDSCAPLFKQYQHCVKEAIKERKIDLLNIEKGILGSDQEKKKPS